MFNVGDSLVYPTQGLATVEAVETKQIAGKPCQFYVLRMLNRNMSVMVPTENAEKIGLREVSFEVGLSPYHFLRMFKRTAGLPPHAYLAQVRLNRARALLKQDISTASVAAHTGFFDQSHLSKAFKRAFGTTPGCYARSIRAGR